MPYKEKVKQKQHYLDNIEQYKWRNFKNKFGLSKEGFFDLLNEQDNKCALCEKPFLGLSGNLVHTDHCHETGRIRGLLCMPCNVGLGMLGDNEEGLLKALEYVRGK